MESTQQTLSQWRAPRWHEHTVARFLIIVGVIVGLYTGYGYATGPSRISDGLRARLDEGPSSVDIRVTSKFPPEEFHIGIYQNLGSMRGVEGDTAKLNSVAPADIRALSRNYWILRIDLAPKDESKR